MDLLRAGVTNGGLDATRLFHAASPAKYIVFSGFDMEIKFQAGPEMATE
jgi:hypothetical protein